MKKEEEGREHQQTRPEKRHEGTSEVHDQLIDRFAGGASIDLPGRDCLSRVTDWRFV
jgi:hypothetical protein